MFCNEVEDKELQTSLSMKIHTYLKSLVKAKVFVSLINWELHAVINEGGVYYEYVDSNICDKICNGISSQQIAQDVSKAYRKYIYNKYFF